MQRSVALIIGLGLLTGVALAQVQPATVVGDIITGGSPSAGALVTRIANRFRTEGYQGNLVVDSIGTTAGFTQFCSGQQDIVNADRLITEAEQSACTATGRTATPFRIASDAIVVAVSPQNTFVNTLSTAELALLFTTALNWSDVRPEWPTAPIQRFIPASGTEDFNYIVENLYGGNSQGFATAIGAQANSDYTIALTNVQSNPNAVGFFPAGFAAQNTTALRTIPINGVAADSVNISAGTYPLVRPIYLYSDLALMSQQTQVGAFINYALAVSGDELVSAGLYPPSPADLAQAKQTAAQGVIQTTIPVAPTATIPVEPPSAVYCASTFETLAINGESAPNAAGCACVRVYGPHQLTSQPDLYTGFDLNQIQTFSQSPTQCVAGVTTYNWRPETGFTDGVLTPNINNLPTATPEAPTITAAQSTLAQTLSILRSDLDLLATAVGGTDRPEGWSGKADVTDPTLSLILRLDLEYLATVAIGGQRPTDWFGSVPSTPEALARDVRHDLELLADAYLPQGERPTGWVGDPNPLVRCDRPTQTLVSLLQRGGVFALSTPPTDANFCLNAMLEVTTFSERTLLTSPVDQPIFSAGVGVIGAVGSSTIDTAFAVAFLDKSAVLSVGVIPEGSPVTAVARSTSEFSRMTLVQGDGFLAFVDYRDTTLTEDDFSTLSNADEYATAPFCSADWCGQ